MPAVSLLHNNICARLRALVHTHTHKHILARMNFELLDLMLIRQQVIGYVNYLEATTHFSDYHSYPLSHLKSSCLLPADLWTLIFDYFSDDPYVTVHYKTLFEGKERTFYWIDETMQMMSKFAVKRICGLLLNKESVVLASVESLVEEEKFKWTLSPIRGCQSTLEKKLSFVLHNLNRIPQSLSGKSTIAQVCYRVGIIPDEKQQRKRERIWNLVEKNRYIFVGAGSLEGEVRLQEITKIYQDVYSSLMLYESSMFVGPDE